MWGAPLRALWACLIAATRALFRWHSFRAAEVASSKRYCGMCGYDLTGTRMAGREVCPECGEIQDACDANAAVFEHGHGN